MDGRYICVLEGDADYKELCDAASSGNNTHLEALLLPPINVNLNALIANFRPAQAPLHTASAMGNVEAIHLLLSNGADVNLRDSREETPLHHAAFGAHTLAVEALLDAGARVDTESGIDMHTPLYSTLRNRQTIGPDQFQIIKLLLDRGADKDAPLECYGPNLVCLPLRGTLEHLLTLS